MEDTKLIIEVIPLVGTQFDPKGVGQEILQELKKYPGVVVNVRVEGICL